MEKKFSKCPCCQSEERFFESLAKELIGRGIARPDFTFCLDAKQGVVIDPTKEVAIPIGSEVPGFLFKSDICSTCGCIYAIEIKSEPVKKTLAPGPPVLPNRAARRRLHLPPGSNNPFMS